MLKYKTARDELPSNEQVIFVDKRPYYPKLIADASLHRTVAHVTCVVLGINVENSPSLTVSVVTGGITNSLLRVSGFRKCSLANYRNDYFDPNMEDSVLVRIFGAEGMIDRDEETATYAALCDANFAYRYLGRFANGRLEGWLEGFRPLSNFELSIPNISKVIAEKLAKLHKEFDLPGVKSCNKPKPCLFDQLWRWVSQAMNIDHHPFKNACDAERAANLIDLKLIEQELSLIQSSDAIPPSASIAFCHNDLLAANIMILESGEEMQIQIIDFEYGGYNYSSFDIANHFNEFAGGTQDAKPDYSLFPSNFQKRHFLESYLNARGGFGENKDEALEMLLEEVDAFVLVNHLYWGLWAVNQAKSEGCGEFDYLLYAYNRFHRFQAQKSLLLKDSSTQENK